MNRTPILLSFLLLLLLIEWYAFQAVKVVVKQKSKKVSKVVYYSYWVITAIAAAMFLYYNFGPQSEMNRIFGTFLRLSLFVNAFAKIIVILFVFIDDIIRAVKWLIKKNKAETTALPIKDGGISRSTFLAKTGLIVAAVPVVSLSWGIVSGAHDYRVRREKLPIANLPAAFQGLRIAQISDIHAGSFWNKTAVKGGVEMLMNEKADLVFFTGDLVNRKSNEMNNWGDVFGKIKAPLGVYSVLGNHDYGDYVEWSSKAAKDKNLLDLYDIERNMGWEALNNEHRIIEIDGQKLGIIGVENWSANHRFPKYGNLSKAMENMEDTAVNILLSHDPSHWQAEVLTTYPTINLTLSGHTHGMQFGVEVPGFKWSPAQYLYDEWVGLYKAKEQYLYVNRGFGYIGYPGRIGILPEITILELEKA